MSESKELFGTDGIRGVANEPPLDPDSVQRLGTIIGWNLVENPLCFTISQASEASSGVPEHLKQVQGPPSGPQKAGSNVSHPPQSSDSETNEEEDQIDFPPGKPTVVIGRDPRASGDMLESALVAGLTASGADVLLAGLITTPGVSYITRSTDANLGVAISASHNPAHFNGFKFFTPSGMKLPRIHEKRIQSQYYDDRPFPPVPVREERIGVVDHEQEALRERYVEDLRNQISVSSFSTPRTILVDSAYGATTELLADVLPMVESTGGAEKEGEEITVRSSGDGSIEYTLLTPSADGTRINEECGSDNTNFLQKKMREESADLGISFDGDGDRVILVDEQGEIIDGDELLAVLATHLKQRDLLSGNTVVGTVMSNQGLAYYFQQNGIDFFRTAVGDRNIQKKLFEENWVLGGEPSGHIIYAEKSPTGDALLIARLLFKLFAEHEGPASELFHPIKKLPQITENVEVEEKPPLEQLDSVQDVIEKWEKQFGDQERVLVRYSGTEPVCRVMAEAPEPERVKSAIREIAAEVANSVGS